MHNDAKCNPAKPEGAKPGLLLPLKEPLLLEFAGARGGPEWEASLRHWLSQLYQSLAMPHCGIQDLARVVLRVSRQITTSQHGFVSAIDPVTGDNIAYTLTELMPNQCSVSDLDRRTVFPRQADGTYAGLWGHALNSKQPFYTNHPSQHPASKGLPKGHLAVQRFLAVPAKLGEEPVGLIALANPQQDYTDHDLEAISQIAMAYALAIQRMRFEEALQAERDFVNTVLQTAGALIVVLDTAGRIERFNQASEEATGYQAAEVLGRRFFKIFLLPEEMGGVEMAFNQLCQGIFPNRHENHWVTKTGHRRLISWTNTALVDGSGAVRHLVCTGIDITEQRVAERAMQQSAEQRRLALEAGQLGTWDYNFATQRISWDSRCRSIFNFRLGGPVSYLRVLAAVHRDDRPHVQQIMSNAAHPSSGGSFHIECRLVWRDHSIHWITISGQAYFEGAGMARKVERLIGTIKDITSRKLDEAVLQASVEQFRLVLEHSNDAIFWAEPETGIIVRCNRKAEELTERTRKELIGMHQAQLHPADRDYSEVFRQAVSVGVVSNLEAEIISRTGKRTPVLINASVVTIGTKKIIQGVFRDITDRVRTEQALRVSERRYRALFEQAGVGVAQVATATGQFLRVNQRFCDIVGYSREELLSLTFRQISHPDDLPRSLKNLEKLKHGQAREYSMEKRYLKKDGSLVWVSLTASPLWQEGEIPGSHVAIVVDITRRKQAEEALEEARKELEHQVDERTAELQKSNDQLRREIQVRAKAEKELKEAEFRYRTVAEFTYDWEYWEAPDGTLRYCSPSCHRISGYTAGEFLTNPKLISQVVIPEDLDLWQKHHHEVETGLQTQVIQFRLRHKEGMVRWVEHACQRVLGEDGSYMGIRCSNRDVTERRESELEKQRLREEFAHVSRITTAGQLAASLAHELNQPLAAIHCNARAAERFLNSHPPDLREVREAMLDIQQDSQRAGKVIHRLRAMFQNTGQERGILQLNDVIQETIDLLHSELVFKGVSSHFQLDPQLSPIEGNRIEFQQVVLNLVLNALESMAEVHGREHRLQIVTQQKDPQNIQVAIRDSGTGIPEAKLNHIFEPFFTTKPTGMGMGLAICRTIVEAHGGRLSAANNPEGGATFFVILPVPPQKAT